MLPAPQLADHRRDRATATLVVEQRTKEPSPSPAARRRRRGRIGAGDTRGIARERRCGRSGEDENISPLSAAVADVDNGGANRDSMVADTGMSAGGRGGAEPGAAATCAEVGDVGAPT